MSNARKCMARSLERARRLCQSAAVIGGAIFLLGMIVGSFLNVCILRIPAGQSVVHPRSRCPQCGKAIAGYDNIPVLSWVLLGGKCRECRTPISAQYPAVELLNGLLFLACYLAFGLSLEAAKWAVLCAVLVVLTITDLRQRLLPDKVNLTGALLGLGFALAVPVDDGTAWALATRWLASPPPEPMLSVVDALVGAAAGYGLLWVVAEGYFRVRGREGMGRGDLKMMGMVGTFAGLRVTLLTIMAAAFIGSALGVSWVGILYVFGWKRKVAERAQRRKLGSVEALRFELARRYQLPFGTFLGAAAVLVIFLWGPVLRWYVVGLR